MFHECQMYFQIQTTIIMLRYFMLTFLNLLTRNRKCITFKKQTQYCLGMRFIDQILQLYNDSDSLCRDIR